MLIKRLNNQRDNITNSQTVVNPVRTHQIAVQLARLRADLVKAQAAKKKACVNEPKVWTLEDYNGRYDGGFTNTRMTIGFTVDNGNVSGDVTSTGPLNPQTGNVPVTASFAGASCGTATLHIDPATGAATTGQVTCTLGGQSQSGQIQAQRGK